MRLIFSDCIVQNGISQNADECKLHRLVFTQTVTHIIANTNPQRQKLHYTFYSEYNCSCQKSHLKFSQPLTIYYLLTVGAYAIKNRKTLPEVKIAQSTDISHTDDVLKMNLTRGIVGYTDSKRTWPVMEIVQSIDFSLTDALKMTLTCKAIVGKNNSIWYDMRWSGMNTKLSVWMEQSHVAKKGDNVERRLIFRPWLDLLAGEYTCHLIEKNHNNAKIYNKSFVISGMLLVFLL